MPMKPVNPLNLEHPDYENQEPIWEKMEDLLLGAERVRSKGSKYLPPSQVEEEEITKAGASGRTDYDRRLESAVFFNGVKRLTRYAMGHIFRVAPKFQGTLPSCMADLEKDCDLLGTPLVSMIEKMSFRSYAMGHYLLMVDFPNTTGIDSRSVQNVVKPRPYLVPVHPSEVINWSMSRSLDGTLEFDWLVHRYAFSEAETPHDQPVLGVYYKIWFKKTWELWKVEIPSGQTVGTVNLTELIPHKISEGPNPISMVPYVPFYSEVVRPMVSQPPLEEAADLNVSHYQMFSEFRHGLRYSLNPIFVTIGTHEDQIKRNAASGLGLPRGGDAKYVETTGNSLKIAMETAALIAAEMWEAGMRSNAAVGANTSAEARKLSRSDFFSFLSSVVAHHEHAWAKVMKLVALWQRQSIENDKPVKLNEDFDIAQLEANQAEFLLNARKAGEISKGLFLSELVRGSVLRGDLDVEAERADAKKDLDEDLEALARAEAIAAPAPEPGAPPVSGGGQKPKPKDTKK